MFRAKILEKIKTHFMYNNFFPKNRVVCGTMWKIL